MEELRQQVMGKTYGNGGGQGLIPHHSIMTHGDLVRACGMQYL